MKTATTIAAIVMFTLGLAALAQDKPAPTTGPATKPAGEDLSRDSGLKDLGENMTREEYEALIKKANENRLKEERKLAAAEITGGFYDPNDSDEAAAKLDTGAANTQADNIKRICEAFAKVDTKFAELYKLYNEAVKLDAKDPARAKKFKDALAKGKAMAAGNTQSTFLQAAKAFVYAQALEDSGADYNDAAEAYTDLVTNMTDRISFAAEAVMRLGQLYDKNGRGIYAMQTYTFMVQNYGLTMDSKQFDGLIEKIKKLKEVYGDPMGTVAKMMSSVKERLAKIDSGKETQLTEKQIIALLDDLIKTEEDKDAQQQQQQQQQNKKKEGEKKEGKGEGEGEGEKPGDKPGKLPNSKPVKKPSKGAPKSVLRNGADPGAGGKVSDISNSKEKGDWSSLPPEEVEKLKELTRLRVNERYRDVIIDYHRSIAGDK